MERQEPKWKISIHAPPRGATLTIDDISTASIFQFTPLREGRRATVSTDRDDLVFQFTPLREGRRATATYQRDVFQFTPLREGRQHTKVGAYKAAIFQFTPLREGRRNWDGTSDLAIAFQFTPLREGRRTDALAAWLGGYFNSRPSARGDYRPACFCRRHAISIHAPPRGATASRERPQISYGFQFTPLREGRRTVCRGYILPAYFNSRPSARGDSPRLKALSTDTYFNSRPSARGDIVNAFKPPGFSDFNSRPSARGDLICD